MILLSCALVLALLVSVIAIHALYQWNKETCKEKKLYEDRCSELNRQLNTGECNGCKIRESNIIALVRDNQELRKFKEESKLRDFELEILRKVTYKGGDK